MDPRNLTIGQANPKAAPPSQSVSTAWEARLEEVERLLIQTDSDLSEAIAEHFGPVPCSAAPGIAGVPSGRAERIDRILDRLIDRASELRQTSAMLASRI